MDCMAEYNDVTELMMREAMDAVHDGIVIVDKTSRILYVNTAYTKILAVPKEKVIYSSLQLFEQINIA